MERSSRHLELPRRSKQCTPAVWPFSSLFLSVAFTAVFFCAAAAAALSESDPTRQSTRFASRPPDGTATLDDPTLDASSGGISHNEQEDDDDLYSASPDEPGSPLAEGDGASDARLEGESSRHHSGDRGEKAAPREVVSTEGGRKSQPPQPRKARGKPIFGPLDDGTIRCKVCFTAIGHAYDHAHLLLDTCREAAELEAPVPPSCDPADHRPSMPALEAAAASMCFAVASDYRAVTDANGEFDLEPTKAEGEDGAARDEDGDDGKRGSAAYETPSRAELRDRVVNPPHVADAVSKACVDWTVNVHSAERVAYGIRLFLGGGLNRDELKHNVQARYCHAACQKPSN